MLIREIIEMACASVRVCEAAGGAEAVAMLRSAARAPAGTLPDLIYLDVEMPGLGGQEVLRRIKADARLKDIPVVMLTGLADEHQKREALRGGAAAYVVKPAEPRRFFEVVRRSVTARVTGPAGRIRAKGSCHE